MIPPAENQCTPLRIGICGAARIARKNIAAIQNPVSNTRCAAIASRSIEKAQEFHHNHVLDEWKDSVSLLVGDNAYDGLIESDDIDAIYIPLPVT
jgi:predicted dehydrogenase